MTPKAPVKPKPITIARLERIRKADPELIELRDASASARLRNITAERSQLLTLWRLLNPTAPDGTQ